MKRSAAALLSAAVLGSLAASLHAGVITPGDVVIYSVGSGGVLTNAATPVFLDEFTPSGTLVQTIPMPTVTAGPNFALTASGGDPSEGQISYYKGIISVPGYGASPGNPGGIASGGIGGPPNVANSTANFIPRVIGGVTLNGAISTSTAFLSPPDFSRGAIRGAATDGNVAFGGGSNSPLPGIELIPYGVSGGGAPLANANNVRTVQYNSTVGAYFSVSNGTQSGIATFAGGLLPGLGPAVTPSPNGFFFADLSPTVAGVDTLYVADDTLGLEKFSLNAGVWTLDGIIGSGADTYRGLSGVVSGSTVKLYATRMGGTVGPVGGGQLVTITDNTGYNGTLSGAPTILASAALGTSFRGVVAISFADLSLSASPTFAATNGSAVTVFTAGANQYQGVPLSITPVAQGSVQINNVGAENGTEVLLHLTGSAADIAAAITQLGNDPAYTLVTPATASDADATGLFTAYNWANLLVRFQLPSGAVDAYNSYFNFDLSPTNVTVDEVTAVPEPASLALLALGGLTLVRRRKRSFAAVPGPGMKT